MHRSDIGVNSTRTVNIRFACCMCRPMKFMDHWVRKVTLRRRRPTPQAPRIRLRRRRPTILFEHGTGRFGLPTLITNCSNNYGPYQFPEKLIPLMTLNAIEGKPLPVYGDGLNVRDWLFVDDHCAAIRKVLLGGTIGETYNVGGGCERTNIDIVRTICKAIDKLLPHLPHRCEDLVTFVQDRPGHDRRYAIDSTRIKKDLGWKPKVTFEEGIQTTVRWFIDHREWVNNITSGVYLRERLGVSSMRQEP